MSDPSDLIGRLVYLPSTTGPAVVEGIVVSAQYDQASKTHLLFVNFTKSHNPHSPNVPVLSKTKAVILGNKVVGRVIHVAVAEYMFYMPKVFTEPFGQQIQCFAKSHRDAQLKRNGAIANVALAAMGIRRVVDMEKLFAEPCSVESLIARTTTEHRLLGDSY